MSKYSFVLKDITCLIQKNCIKDNEKIKKLWTDFDFQNKGKNHQI